MELLIQHTKYAKRKYFKRKRNNEQSRKTEKNNGYSHRNDTYADCDQLPRPGVFRFFPENDVSHTKPNQWMPIRQTLLSGPAKTVPAAFAPTMACTECASCVVRNASLPTMHGIDIATCHSFQSIHRVIRTDYPCTVFAFDCTSDLCILVDSDTVMETIGYGNENKCKQNAKMSVILLITKACQTQNTKVLNGESEWNKTKKHHKLWMMSTWVRIFRKCMVPFRI